MDLLPGFYVLALGVVLAVLLKALGDSLPFRAWLIFGAVLSILLGPVLVGGELLLPLDSLRGSPPFQLLSPTEPHGNLLQGDLIQLVFPLSKQVRGELTAGRWPLWNPLAGAGMPLLSDPQAQPLQPLVLLAYPFDPLRAPAVTAALRILCALAFCCALFRRLGLRDGPAVAGAVAYGCGGFLLLWLGWPLANTAALLPVVLYATVGCLASGGDSFRSRRRSEIFLAAAVACLLLAGHPETILYAGLFAGAFAVILFRRQDAGGDSFTKRFSRIGVPVLVAVAVTAPVLLPTAAYLPHTWRAATLSQNEVGPDAESFSPGSLGPESPGKTSSKSGFEKLVRAWAPLAAPNAFGNSRYVHYWGKVNSNEDSSGFVGTVTLLAALLGAVLMVARGRSLFPGEGLALAVAFLVPGILACFALGSGTFLLGAHGGGRLRMLFAFSVAYLAACTLERLQWERYKVSWLRGSLLGLGAAFAVFQFLVYLRLASPAGPEVLRELRFGWLHWHLRFLVAGVLLFALAPRRRWMPWAAAMFVAGELLLAFQDANPPMPRRLAFPVPPPLEAALKLDKEPRLVALGDALPPNLAMVYGIGDARIYNPMEPALYAALIEPLLEQPRENVPRAAVADHPLYDLLGVRFVLTGPGVDLPSPLQLAVDDPSGRLYRRPTARDVLFLPATATALSGASWPAAVHHREDVLQSSLVIADEGIAWRARLPKASRLDRVRQEGPRVQAFGRLHEDRLLASRLLAVGADSGWRLLSNGVPQRTITANGPLLAAWLPAGSHDLNLLYRPPGFLFGCVLAALGLCAGFLRWWLPLAPSGPLQSGRIEP